MKYYEETTCIKVQNILVIIFFIILLLIVQLRCDNLYLIHRSIQEVIGIVLGRCVEVLRFVGAEDHQLSHIKTTHTLPPGPEVLLASMTIQQARAEVGALWRGQDVAAGKRARKEK